MGKKLSTFAIARMLHVDPGSVANWIDQKLLKAYRTPGGHRRVATEDLLQFLREHRMPTPPELSDGSVRIVIVDDEPSVARMVARVIKAAHPEFEVAEAHDGFQAGTLCATLKPDVVVLDLRIPGMDGYEVCRLIKSQDSTKHTAVLAMTAYPSAEAESRILQCGARVCLSKPLETETLLEHIRASLSDREKDA